MQIIQQPFIGTYLIEPKIFHDNRGCFVKTYHTALFKDLGLPLIEIQEEFWSVSSKGVLRGLHFQLPPHDHDKIVTCLCGSVLDVLLDLRVNSPTYKTAWSTQLTQANGRILLIPKGVGHGFYSQENGSLMLYKTSTVHAPESDAGIRWNSIGFDWPDPAPVISKRDENFPPLNTFVSPF